MNREVRDWLSNLALAVLVGLGILLLTIPAQAQSITWKVDGPASCTVVCTPAGAPVPTPPGPPQPPAPVEPAPPASPCAGLSPAFMAAVDRGADLQHMVLWILRRAPTQQELACARERKVPGSEVVVPTPGVNPAPAIDPWTHRDLTGTHGNVLKMEGHAGRAEVFQLREPVGKRVTITGLQIISSFGACGDIEVRAQGQSARSNQVAKLTITSTGNDPVTLVLHCAGGAGVQINPG